MKKGSKKIKKIKKTEQVIVSLPEVETPISPDIKTDVEPTITSTPKTDGEMLQEFLTEFKMTPEMLCRELDHGSVTLIKGIINGTMGLNPPMRGIFLSYMRSRKRRKAGL